MKTKEELLLAVQELIPDAQPGEESEWLNIRLTAEQWQDTMEALKQHAGLELDFLFCLTCIDWKDKLEMIYHTTSTRYRHVLVFRVILDRNQPIIHTCSHVWKTALFHEREVYEMFGVQFTGHPDLRLLILPEGWEGKNPLRKDFEDPVNMIRL